MILGTTQTQPLSLAQSPQKFVHPKNISPMMKTASAIEGLIVGIFAFFCALLSCFCCRNSIRNRVFARQNDAPWINRNTRGGHGAGYAEVGGGRVPTRSEGVSVLEMGRMERRDSNRVRDRTNSTENIRGARRP